MDNTIFNSAFLLLSGGLVAFFLRELPMKIFKWIQRKTLYQVSIYQNDELFDVVEDYMFLHHKNRYSDVEASIEIGSNNISTINSRDKKLRFKQEENFFVIRTGGKRVLISKSKEKVDKAQALRDLFYRKYIIKGFRAKREINEFLENIVSEFNKARNKQMLRVYVNTSWGEWNCVNDILVKPFSKVILPQQQKNIFLDDLSEFQSSREWYTERGIRYKRSYLLHGSPGNGKTSIAMAIAEYTGKDVYVLNISALENDAALIRSFTCLNSNIVLLIEDIDRAFVKRENKESKISFSALLNSLDGALCREGMITVVTTNHIEHLDEALIREGRMDMKMEVLNPSPTEIKEYIELFYGIKLSTEIQGGDKSMAYVQEYCIRHKDNSLAAINHFSQQTEQLKEAK